MQWTNKQNNNNNKTTLNRWTIYIAILLAKINHQIVIRIDHHQTMPSHCK